MKESTGCSLRTGTLFFCGLLLYSSLSCTQKEKVEPGRAIGKVSTNGDLIVMELDDSALGKTNRFDLVGHTLRFTGAFRLSRQRWMGYWETTTGHAASMSTNPHQVPRHTTNQRDNDRFDSIFWGVSNLRAPFPAKQLKSAEQLKSMVRSISNPEILCPKGSLSAIATTQSVDELTSALKSTPIRSGFGR